MDNNMNTDMYEHEVFVEKQPLMPIHKKIVNLIISPGEVFENLKTHPKILVPILVTIVLSLIYTFVATPYTQLTLENLNEVYRQMGVNLDLTANATAGFMQYFSIPIGILFTFALSGIFNWIAVRITGVKISIKDTYAVTAHVLILQYILLVITMAINSYVVKTGVDVFSLAILMKGLTAKDFMYFFSQGVSLVAIWTIILTGFGIAKVANVKAIRGIIPIAVMQFIFILGTAGMGYLSIYMMDQLY